MRTLIILGVLFFPVLAGATTYGSNVLVSGTPSADCTRTSPSEDPDKAFDGNLGTWWNSCSSGFPHYIQYDLGAGITATPGKIYLGTDSANNLYVKNFDFKGSNDGTNFFTIYTGLFANPGAQTQEFIFTPTTTEYRYFRIHLIDNDTGGGNTFNEMAEWEMYEEEQISTMETNLYELLFLGINLFLILITAYGVFKILNR